MVNFMLIAGYFLFPILVHSAFFIFSKEYEKSDMSEAPLLPLSVAFWPLFIVAGLLLLLGAGLFELHIKLLNALKNEWQVKRPQRKREKVAARLRAAEVVEEVTTVVGTTRRR